MIYINIQWLGSQSRSKIDRKLEKKIIELTIIANMQMSIITVFT